ncbi:MAG: ThuA domain-containing protein [Rhodothermales bacterium]
MRTAYLRLSGYSLVVALFALSACQQASSTSDMPAEKSSVLFLSGQNNHAWEETNVLLMNILEEPGLFEVTKTLTPPKGSAPEAWNDWHPDFGSYDVVVLDYNGEMWPDDVKSAFESYINGGGTALMVHASNNPFPGWTAYEQMVGMLWRRPDDGTTVYLDDAGAPVRLGPGEGPRSGHGKLHDWKIEIRDRENPIMKGLPDMWMHPHDELYHGQRGPAENMNILASAYSDTTWGGTGKNELMIWWIPYGQGKVLTFLPGHHWANQDDERAFYDVGFRTVLNRSVEWLATGKVTIPVPPNFPTADAVSLKNAP